MYLILKLILAPGIYWLPELNDIRDI